MCIRDSLRPDLPLLAGAEDGAGGRGLRADPGGHLLLGPAHGGGAARLGAGGPRLFVLRRVLRHRAHRLGEGVGAPLCPRRPGAERCVNEPVLPGRNVVHLWYYPAPGGGSSTPTASPDTNGAV